LVGQRDSRLFRFLQRCRKPSQRDLGYGLNYFL
jgi:hypothetical protein